MQTYYEKWAAAVAVTSIERGTITQKDLDEALGMSHATPEVLCALLPLKIVIHYQRTVPWPR